MVLVLLSAFATARGAVLYDYTTPIPGLTVINVSNSSRVEMYDFEPIGSFFPNPLYEIPEGLTSTTSAESIPVILRSAKVGETILDNLLTKDGKPNLDRLAGRVYDSNSAKRRVVADHIYNGEYDLSENIPLTNSVLQNNYILVQQNNYKQLTDTTSRTMCNWHLYRLGLPADIGELAAYGRLTPEVIAQQAIAYVYVGSGEYNLDTDVHESTYEANRPQRDVAKVCAAFAPRSGVIDTHSRFTAARIGKGDYYSMNPGSRFKAMRTYLTDRNDTIQKKIGLLRATRVADGKSYEMRGDSSLFYVISGKRPRPGDVLVYDPDKKMATSFMATNDFNMWGGQIRWDYMLAFSRYGVAQYGSLIVGVKGTHEVAEVYQVKNAEATDMKKIDFAGVADVRFSYGVGFNFWHWFEFNPYISGGVSFPFVIKVSKSVPLDNKAEILPNSLDDTKEWMGYNVTPGIRLNMNICYPVMLTLGGEYVVNFYNKYTDELNRMVLEPRGKELRDGLQLFAGIKINF